MQQDYARRSSNSKLIIAEKSGHAIHQDEPELVIDAIKQVMNIARTKIRERTSEIRMIYRLERERLARYRMRF